MIIDWWSWHCNGSILPYWSQDAGRVMDKSLFSRHKMTTSSFFHIRSGANIVPPNCLLSSHQFQCLYKWSENQPLNLGDVFIQEESQLLQFLGTGGISYILVNQMLTRKMWKNSLTSHIREILLASWRLSLPPNVLAQLIPSTSVEPVPWNDEILGVQGGPADCCI